MKDFEKYLFDLLWNSGEDCCTMCVHNRCDDLCDNHKRAKEKGCDLDDYECFLGMKEYFEKNE